MLTGVGAWLRKQREARGWARREMARRLTQAAQATGDMSVPTIENLCTYIRRWEFGRHGPTERYVLYFCTAFGISPEEFGTAQPPPPPKPKPEDRTLARSRGLPAGRTLTNSALAPSDTADGHRAPSIAAGFDLGHVTLERDVLKAAHDGSDRAGRYYSTAPSTFEQLRADLTRLARLCDTGEPVAVFLDLRRVSDRIERLLDRQLWPLEQTDLHVLLSCISGLMGITVLRLGHPDAAAEMIRTGWAYAEALHHKPLRGILRAQLSSVMYWSGKSRTAVTWQPTASNTYPTASMQLACISASLGQRRGRVTPRQFTGPLMTRMKRTIRTAAMSCWRWAVGTAFRERPISVMWEPPLPASGVPNARRLWSWNAPSSCTTKVQANSSSTGSAASRWPASTWLLSGCALGRWTPLLRRWNRLSCSRSRGGSPR